jgi:hypothetical protein
MTAFRAERTLLSPAMVNDWFFSRSVGICVKTKETYRAMSALEVNEIVLLPSPAMVTFPLGTSRSKNLAHK